MSPDVLRLLISDSGLFEGKRVTDVAIDMMDGFRISRPFQSLDLDGIFGNIARLLL